MLFLQINIPLLIVMSSSSPVVSPLLATSSPPVPPPYFPVTERMAELFQQEGYTGNITVDSIGSGAGFERFCVAGESDISNASRPIKDSEVEQCQAIGREPLEFRVGTDALAVVVSAENDFVTNLTLEQLGQMFSGEITTWDQVDPSFPAETIQIYTPGADSGTFDYFVEAVMEEHGGAEALLAREGASTPKMTTSLFRAWLAAPMPSVTSAMLTMSRIPTPSRRLLWKVWSPARKLWMPPSIRLPVRSSSTLCRHHCRETSGCRLHLLLPDQPR
jgi:hypothetical protein